MATSKLPTGITKRGEAYRWSCMVDGKRRSGSEPTLEKAIEERARTVERLKHGGATTVTPSKADHSWTLQKAYETTLNLPAPEGWLGIKHPGQVEKLAKQVLTFFGGQTKVGSITKADADAYVAHLMHIGNSNSTINQKLCTLSKMLRVAHRNGGLTAMPPLPKRLRLNNARDRELSPAEEATLIKLMGDMGKSEQADAVACLIDMGCRNSELWAVEARDVDFKSGLVLLYGTDGKGTKNGTFRSVPMSRRVTKIMKDRVANTTAVTDKVFPYDNFWLRTAWDRCRTLMNLDSDPQFVPYICRHTCASRLVRGGAPIPVVQKWLGHKTIQMTMRYAHLMPTDLLQHVSIMDNQKEHVAEAAE